MERRIAIGHDRASLDRIARPDAALAIWWRKVPEPLRSALATLDLSAVDNLSVEVDLCESVGPALQEAGYRGTAYARLCEDLDMLMRRHAALTGEDRLRVRLAVVETPIAGRFDADDAMLAMTCTYIGPGIQWCCADGLDAIYEVPTGAVGVFKGRRLLDPPLVLRREPAMAAAEGRRLVLTIDPPGGCDRDGAPRSRPQADLI